MRGKARNLIHENSSKFLLNSIDRFSFFHHFASPSQVSTQLWNKQKRLHIFFSPVIYLRIFFHHGFCLIFGLFHFWMYIFFTLYVRILKYLERTIIISTWYFSRLHFKFRHLYLYFLHNTSKLVVFLFLHLLLFCIHVARKYFFL